MRHEVGDRPRQHPDRPDDRGREGDHQDHESPLDPVPRVGRDADRTIGVGAARQPAEGEDADDEPYDRQERREPGMATPRRWQHAWVTNPDPPPPPAEAAPRAVIVFGAHRQHGHGAWRGAEARGIREVATADLHGRRRQVGEGRVFLEMLLERADASRPRPCPCPSGVAHARARGERGDRTPSTGMETATTPATAASTSSLSATTSSASSANARSTPTRASPTPRKAMNDFGQRSIVNAASLGFVDHVLFERPVPALRHVVRARRQCLGRDDAVDRLVLDRAEHACLGRAQRLVGSVTYPADGLPGLHLVEIHDPAGREIQQDRRRGLARDHEVGREHPRDGRRFRREFHARLRRPDSGDAPERQHDRELAEPQHGHPGGGDQERHGEGELVRRDLGERHALTILTSRRRVPATPPTRGHAGPPVSVVQRAEKGKGRR